jgi:hypothetical protein
MTKEILVPESASEIPLNRYQKFMAMPDENRFDFIKLFSCLTGCTEDEARQVKATDVARSVNALIKALNDTNSPLIEKYSHNGVIYGLEPKLDEISFALMADLCTAFETPETWHKVLAILYRPIIREHKSMGGMYAIETHSATSKAYQKRQEMFAQAPSSLFISVRSFFLRGSKALEKFTLDSLFQPTERVRLRSVPKTR